MLGEARAKCPYACNGSGRTPLIRAIPNAHLSVEVKIPSVTHVIVVQKFDDWLYSGARSPKKSGGEAESAGFARYFISARFLLCHKARASDSRYIGVATQVIGIILAVQGASSVVALIWGSIAILRAEPVDPEEAERASMRSLSWPTMDGRHLGDGEK